MTIKTEDTSANTPTTPVTAVANLADAREKKAKKDDVAPMEAYAPVATRLQDDEWQIMACDGEQVYMWIARKKSKRSKGFTITEVYPAMSKKHTELREVKKPIDLEIRIKRGEVCATMQDVIEDLEEIVFADFEDDETDETASGA